MMTELQLAFDRLGLNTARNHYRQAIESLADRRYEAANSQLRATFEDVIVNMAESVGFVRRRPGGSGRAIAFLIEGGQLEAGNGGDYIRGLWKIVQTNIPGRHPLARRTSEFRQ